MSAILCHIILMARTGTYDRLNRLDLLASRLKSEEPMTVGELSKEFSVSSRTLSRDIAILRERGLPIEADSGRGGGIRLHRTWGIGRLSLSYQEAVELLFSLAIAERLDSPWALVSLSSIRRKLSASFSPAMRDRIDGLRRRIHVGLNLSARVLDSFRTPDAECMEAMFQAFLEMRTLAITYVDVDGHHTDRSIEPHHLLLKNPIWYLYAWDSDKNAVRCFRCDRIEAAAVEPTGFSDRPFEGFAEAMKGTDATPV